jgi:hypothetical protein
VQDDNKCGTAIGGNVAEKFLESGDATGRGADSDN